MDIKGFDAAGGGISARISNDEYIASIDRQNLLKKTNKKFNKVFDYMRLENLKKYLKEPKMISSSNTTLIIGKIKKDVNPDEIFKNDLEYCSKVINKPPLLGLDGGSSNIGGNINDNNIININKDFITVQTNNPKINLPEEFVYQGDVVYNNPLTVKNNYPFKQTGYLGGGDAAAKENLKEFKAPNTENNKKKLLFAVNPQAGRWQVEGEENMKHIATALHRFADIIPSVHYGEFTPELAKKGFDTLNSHFSKGLGLKL